MRTGSTSGRICRSPCRSGARPDGDELLLVGSTSAADGFLPEYGYRDLFGAFEDPTGSGIGLYLVDPDGSELRPITPSRGHPLRLRPRLLDTRRANGS